MKVVMDAQLLAGYFREAEKGEQPSYSGSVVQLVRRFGKCDLAFVDEGGIIEQEYRDLVDPEWFDAWFSLRLEVGDFVILPAPGCPDLIKQLSTKFGFPAGSKDRHYIALACAIVGDGDEGATIVSEDLDFYDPKAKQGSAKRRAKLLADETGPVKKFLARKASVTVRSVAGHLSQ
jgi:hypothetical protein